MYYKKKTYTYEEALIKLQKYCIYQDRSHMEVEKKLKEMSMIPEAVNKIIISLIEEDYLNEERFAFNYARGKFKLKKWGKRRLKSELKRKGVTSNLISLALDEISDFDYKRTFDELAKRKACTINSGSVLKKRKQLADYLIYRGWETNLVYDKLNEIFKKG
tara:strand:+ start:14713 stop:15195 length:483 start_codon:yes stop_codon:yes gene_type:complete